MPPRRSAIRQNKALTRRRRRRSDRANLNPVDAVEHLLRSRVTAPARGMDRIFIGAGDDGSAMETTAQCRLDRDAKPISVESGPRARRWTVDLVAVN
jgi:hypothetical protein